MPANNNNISDLFSNWQKIFSFVVAIVVAISTMAIAYYKINDNTADIDALDKKYEHRFEDERDTNTKLRLKILELEIRVNKDEVDAAYHKGHSDATEEFLKEEIKKGH